MEENSEIVRIRKMIVDAMRISTDPVTAAGAENVLAFALETVEQARHIARCIAAFTTDDALATEMAEIVGESPRFLIGKVLMAQYAPEQCTGTHAALERQLWKSLYAGRRELSRVQQTLVRRSVL